MSSMLAVSTVLYFATAGIAASAALKFPPLGKRLWNSRPAEPSYYLGSVRLLGSSTAIILLDSDKWATFSYIRVKSFRFTNSPTDKFIVFTIGENSLSSLVIIRKWTFENVVEISVIRKAVKKKFWWKCMNFENAYQSTNQIIRDTVTWSCFMNYFRYV